MTNLRLITRSACALGAAILATTALQSTPAEARVHAGGHTRASAHSVGHKVSSRISKELPGQNSPTGGGGGGGGGNDSPQSKPHDGGRPVPPGGIPSGPTIPAGGGGKQIPTGGGKQTQTTGIPTTGPINPGSLPGYKPTEQTPTPPPVVTSNPGPIPPVLNPGNVPGTKQTPGPKPVPPPGSNAGGGGYRPPVIGTNRTPPRAPIPPVIANPSYGTGATSTQGHGVYADIGADGGDYDACRLFKSNYDRTGNAYWLNRYRVCLWQR
jgi:hypothetical protein